MRPCFLNVPDSLGAEVLGDSGLVLANPIWAVPVRKPPLILAQSPPFHFLLAWD